MVKNEVLLFDFDGVLVDTFDINFQVQKKFEPGVTKESFRQKYNKNINRDPRFLILKKSEQKAEDSTYSSLYAPLMLKQPLISGMEKVVKQLAKTHLLLVVSSANTEPIRKFLKQNGLLRYFGGIYGSDVNFSKINKINMILAEYKLNPNDCIFVTDTLGDILEAKRCRVRSVAVTWGYHSSETLLKGRPLMLAREPNELSEFFK